MKTVAPVVGILRHIAENEGYLPTSATTLAEARDILSQDSDFDIATVDFNLPDSVNGEAIPLVLEHDIPAIVMTGQMDDATREKILAHPIMDYVPKETTQAFSYLQRLLGRVHKNSSLRVLVVDDSSTARAELCRLIGRHKFLTAQAKNGKEALKVLEHYQDIKMVITDHEMPEMGGIRLVSEIRKKYHQDSLAIIGISGAKQESLPARFIKNGANDFLKKPFSAEELFCRLIQNIERVENIEAVRESANSDYLTGLANRRSFFFQTKNLVDKPYCLAMVDIDHFKKVNDSLGHDAGDHAIKFVAEQLLEHFPQALIARFGGEEYCLFFADVPIEQADPELQSFCHSLSEMSLQYQEHQIKLTVSIGVCAKQNSLDASINKADHCLYDAKNGGRNQVVRCED